MPTPIQEELIVPTAVKYLLKRQIDNLEPTSQYKLSQRMGMGVEAVQSRLLRAGVEFFLMPINGEGSSQKLTMLYIRSMPLDMLDAYGYGPEHLSASISFSTSVPEIRNGEMEEVELGTEIQVPEEDPVLESVVEQVPLAPIPFLDEEPAAEDEVDEVVQLDPYAPYRIDAQQFEVLRPQLLPSKELYAAARAQGFAERAINRAVGGDKMVFQPVGPFWRPFVYKGTRWYLKELLDHLEESDYTYRIQTARDKKRAKRAAFLSATFLAAQS